MSIDHPETPRPLDSVEEIGQLKQAIDTNDIDRVKTMMTRNPALHSAPLGAMEEMGRSRGLLNAASHGNHRAPRDWPWRRG
jgi:hypothetical protein